MLLRNDKGEFFINDYLAQLVTDDIYDEVYEDVILNKLQEVPKEKVAVIERYLSVIIGSTCKSILVKQKEYI